MVGQALRTLRPPNGSPAARGPRGLVGPAVPADQLRRRRRCRAGHASARSSTGRRRSSSPARAAASAATAWPCCSRACGRRCPRACGSRCSSPTRCCAPSGCASPRSATCSPAVSGSPRRSSSTARWRRCGPTSVARPPAARRRAVPRQPDRPGLRRLPARAPAGGGQALGVQLVYTTGLFDAGALSVFPLIVRLRNDADLRAGLKYLSIDAEIGRALDALDEPDGSGRVAATRVFRRPVQA